MKLLKLNTNQFYLIVNSLGFQQLIGYSRKYKLFTNHFDLILENEIIQSVEDGCELYILPQWFFDNILDNYIKGTKQTFTLEFVSKNFKPINL